MKSSWFAGTTSLTMSTLQGCTRSSLIGCNLETKMRVQVCWHSWNGITMTQVMYTQLLFFSSPHTHTHSIIYHSIILCVCLEWTRAANNTINTPMPDALNMSVVLVDRYKGNFFLQSQREILELSVKSPSSSPPISSTFGSLFQCYPQSNEILLNLGMKCWNSAFNAQSSRVIIVVVQLVGAVQALRKKGNTGWNSVFVPPISVEKLVWVPVIFLL
jgi:hypothetical protein